MAVHKHHDMNYEARLNFVNCYLHGLHNAEMVPPSFCSAEKLCLNSVNISLIFDNTTMAQLKICDISGETLIGFEVLQFSMSATTTQLLSSGQFCKLRYDITPVKIASANVSFYTSNSKMPNYEL